MVNERDESLEQKLKLEIKINRIEGILNEISSLGDKLNKLKKDYEAESLGSAYEHLSKAKERLRYVCDKTIEEIEKIKKETK